VDFSEIVDSCALEFDAVAFDRGVMLDSNVEEGIHLQGDPEWLGRLAKILIDNATKYARKGTEVKVTLKRTSQHIVLSVNNQGDPIDPEDLPHLFDRFYRSDKARSRGEGEQGGFGLGLAIAKGIAEVHGGTIRATSTKADGTTFTVTL
jgi:signal transduction histidine kinase